MIAPRRSASDRSRKAADFSSSVAFGSTGGRRGLAAPRCRAKCQAPGSTGPRACSSAPWSAASRRRPAAGSASGPSPCRSFSCRRRSARRWSCKRAGDDLGRRSRAAVDQKHDGLAVDQVTRLGVVAFAAARSAAPGRDDLALFEEGVRDGDRLVQKPAGVVAQVEDDTVDVLDPAQFLDPLVQRLDFTPEVVWSLKVVIRRTTVLPTTRPFTAVSLIVSRMIETSKGSACPGGRW